jgi:hypothetical protein
MTRLLLRGQEGRDIWRRFTSCSRRSGPGEEEGLPVQRRGVDALSKLVETTVSAAGARAKANKRQTIKASDI